MHDILATAAQLVLSGWSRNAQARDKNNREIYPLSPYATHFSLDGALDRATYDLDRTLDELADAVLVLAPLLPHPISLELSNDDASQDAVASWLTRAYKISKYTAQIRRDIPVQDHEVQMHLTDYGHAVEVLGSLHDYDYPYPRSACICLSNGWYFDLKQRLRSLELGSFPTDQIRALAPYIKRGSYAIVSTLANKEEYYVKNGVLEEYGMVANPMVRIDNV